MIISVVSFLVAIIITMLLRRQTNRQPTATWLVGESLFTGSTGFLFALMLWLIVQQWRIPIGSFLTSLLWLIMFVGEVIAVRLLGTHFAALSQTAPSSLNIAKLVDGLSYHAATFWQLMVGVMLFTIGTTHSWPNSGLLIGWSFVMSVAITLQSAVKLFHVALYD